MNDALETLDAGGAAGWEEAVATAVVADLQYCWPYIRDLSPELISEPSYCSILQAAQAAGEAREPGKPWPGLGEILRNVAPEWEKLTRELSRSAFTPAQIEQACSMVRINAHRRDEIRRLQRQIDLLSCGESTDLSASFEPLRLFERDRDLPPCPVGVLPELLQGVVATVAQSRLVPAELPALVSLGVVATAVQGRVGVRLAKHAEQLSLYAVVSMESGERKSGVFEDLTAVLHDYEAELWDQLRPAAAEAEARRSVLENAIRSAEKRAAATADHDERELLTRESAESRQMLGEIRTVTQPMLFVMDSTPEDLASRLCANDGRLALLEPEGGCLLSMMGGRYDPKQKPNFELILRAYGGDAYRGSRKGRADVEYARHPALSIVSACQPCVLRELVGNPGMNLRGLVSRFVWVEPNTLVGSRLYDGAEAVDRGVLDEFNSMIRGLFKLPAGSWIELDPDAQRIWTRYHDSIERQMAEGGRYSRPEVRAWAAKHAGRAARLAALLHLAGERGVDRRIDAQTMLGAVDLAEWLLGHALPLLGEVSPDALLAQRMADWFRREELPDFTLRQAYRRLECKADDARDAAEWLVHRGYLAPIASPPPGSRGGRPSPSYRVNPRLCFVGSVRLSGGLRITEREREEIKIPITDSQTEPTKTPEVFKIEREMADPAV